ncbi:MAG: GNAT family N-acetyltransferase [Desulfobacterales bacterium]
MAVETYWADNYVKKKKSAYEAIGLIRPGQRVFTSASCGEPQALLRVLADEFHKFPDLEVVRLLSLESSPLTLIANKSMDRSMNIRSFYAGSGKPAGLARNIKYITPINLSAVPRLFKSRLLPINVALIQVSPPDDFGWMSLGVAVDITLAAAYSADLVIAQVNNKMPRVLGRSFIHVNDVDVIVERDEDLLTVENPPELEAANIMAGHIARLIDDGSTIQIGLGTTSQAVMLALSDKNDLGIHTQYLTDDIMKLISKGIITNRRKGFNDGKVVASSALGTKYLYEFMDDNPAIEFYPSDYVNDAGIISQHNRMVSMNVGMAIDLTGQVAADALPFNFFSGITGMLDFIRGSALSRGGKSFILLTSTTASGKKSRIVPTLTDTAVVVPRSDINFVATEYGVVNLFGKNIQERAIALISIAHPDFRENLFESARQMGLIGPERTVKDTLQAVYPLKIEQTIEISGNDITIRPAKAVDERRIQEHFYSLDKQDIISRFFHEKERFITDEIESVSQVDYIKNLTLIATVGEYGFSKVVGIAEYQLDETTNIAEIAFSISKSFQGIGLGKHLIKKLAEAARENGIAGFKAYTSPKNESMIRLFKSLPYKVQTTLKEGTVILICRFDNPNE